MDLQHPLRSIVPSLDWAVLEVLSSTESGLGSSQIARLSNEGSRSGQVPILDRLVRHGIVIAEPANQGFLYRLNRDHLLAPSILQAAGLRKRLLDLIGELARQLVPLPVHASVFGSFARGEAGEESDIDILLIAPTDEDVTEWDAAVEHIEDTVRCRTGNGCSCMTFGLERLRELGAQGEPIVKNWAVDGVVLLGDRLHDLLVTDIATDIVADAVTPTKARRKPR